MNPSIEKKSIFITGCSSGIGLEVALDLQKRGNFHVITSCRKAEDVELLKQKGFDCIQLDQDDSSSVQQAAKEVLRLTNGKLYALFNNAGFGLYGLLSTISRKQLEHQFSTNLFGLHELTLLLLPAMLEQNEGRIIQTSSVMGFISAPGRGSYAASKHALEAWSDALRLELYHTGIKVCLIEPGPIKTKFTQNVQQSSVDNLVTNTTFVQRFALGPESILPAIHHALTSTRPKIRYRITIVTHLAAIFKRILPNRWQDFLLVQK